MIKITEGNKKLKGDGKSEFLIFDLPAVTTCPASTPMCRQKCYAMKAQRMYKATRAMRDENYHEAQKIDFIPNMIQAIQDKLNRKKYQNKTVYFRIHSSGDFFNIFYFTDWLTIINNFPQVNFTAYTKSLHDVKFFAHELPTNFKLFYSVFPDTNPEYIAIAKHYNLPIFYAVQAGEYNQLQENNVKCEMDCKICKNCYDKSQNDIYCKIH